MKVGWLVKKSFRIFAAASLSVVISVSTCCRKMNIRKGISIFLSLVGVVGITIVLLPWSLRGNLIFTDLPLDISMAEWKSIYSQYQFLEHVQTTSKCSFDVTGGSPLEKRSLSNMTDWSYKRRINCPKTNFKKYSFKRKGLALFCDKDVSNIYVTNTNTTATINSIPFGSSCLNDAIENCCHIKGESIPNVVHYIFCGRRELGFYGFLSFMSIVRFVRPCMILIHGDKLPYGDYWNYFISIYSNVIQVKRDCLFGGSGHRLGYFEHGTDLMRIEALLMYGGIYLDLDEVILQPIDELRKYDHVQGYEQQDIDPIKIGSQFIMSKKNSSFLNLWYESYIKDYRRNDWAYNALTIPGRLSKKHPNLIHVPPYYFTRPMSHKQIHYWQYKWSLNYAIHIFQRYYRYHIDENSIRNLDTTVGSVSRHVLFNNKELCL